MTKTIIFDFDGTIADSIPLMLDIFNRSLAKKYGLAKITDRKSLRELDLKELIGKSGLSHLRILLLLFDGKRIFSKRISELELIPGMDSALRGLGEEYSLGIVSSGSVGNIESVLRRCGIRERFDFVVSKRALFGKHKALLKVMRKRGIEPSSAVYVGDEVRDIWAARKAGIRIVSVSWGMNSEKRLLRERPDFLARKPKDLLKLITKMK